MSKISTHKIVSVKPGHLLAVTISDGHELLLNKEVNLFIEDVPCDALSVLGWWNDNASTGTGRATILHDDDANVVEVNFHTR